MAHFRGTLRGGRGEASRLGTKNSGLTVEAQSWQGKAVTYLNHDASGNDILSFWLEPHNGAGIKKKIINLHVDGRDANPYWMIQQILWTVDPDKRAATLDAVARDMGLNERKTIGELMLEESAK